MNLEELIEKLRSGEISKELAQEFMQELTRYAGNGKTKGGSHLTAEEQEALLNEGLALSKGSPEMQKLQQEIIADKNSTRLGKRFAPFFSAIMAGADIATSTKQIRQSNEAIRSLRKPGMPAIPGADPALDGAIREAEIGTMDAARAVAPAVQGIDDTYSRDMALAKTVGGGQASTMGAMGQVASMRRNRALGSLAPQIDAIKAREEGRLDGLIGQRMRQRNQDYYNRFSQADVAMGQYNLDTQTAGQLGATGRLNRRNAINQLLTQAPNVIGRIGGYRDKYDDYEMQLNQSITGNRFNESDIYGAQTPIQTTPLNNSNQYNWEF